MATYNTVPLGQAGTGSAFRLGENRALPLFQQDVERQRLEREAQAQKLAKSWRDNALAASKGQLFASELGKIEQDHIQKGYQLRQQGIDPYNPDVNNPAAFKQSQDYMTERRDIENKRAYRDGLEARYKDYMTTLSKATEGEYDPATVSEINKVVSEGSLNDLYNRGATLPQLQKRFNLRNELKGIQAPIISTTKTVNGNIETDQYVDKNQARQVVLSTIANNPAGQAALLKATGGLPVQEVMSLPETKELIRARLNEDYTGHPQLVEQLALNQIRVGSDRYNKLLDEQVDKAYEAKKGLNSLVNDGVSQISQGVKTIDSTKPEMTEAERRRLGLAEQANARANEANNRARVRFEERNTNGDTQTTYRQQLVDDMLRGVPGSGEKVKGITKSSGKYGEDTFDILVKGNNLQFTVPPEIRLNTKGDPVVKKAGRTVTINREDPAARTALNALISEVTGENISDSKFNSGNASGKMKSPTTPKPATTKKSVPLSKVKSLVGKPGYEGYTERELVDYYKSQGYNIQ